MEGFTSEGKVVGVILDLSLRHDPNGRRIVDIIKKKLTALVKQHMEDDVDVFYLYHPELVETLSRHGEEYAAIGNYDTDGWQFNISYALKQTLYVLAAEDLDYRKYLLFITDRLTDTRPLEKAFDINEKMMIDCHLIVIGVGPHYCKDAVGEVTLTRGASHIHLAAADEFSNSLFEEPPHASECPTRRDH